MFDSPLIIGVICLTLVVVGLGVAAWLYSMTNAGKTAERGHDLGFW